MIGAIIGGLIVGILAKVFMPGRDPGGIIVTILLGIGGSLLGTFVGQIFFGRGYSAGWIMSILGAIALLAIYRMITGQRST